MLKEVKKSHKDGDLWASRLETSASRHNKKTAEEKTSELQSCQKELSSVRNEIKVLEEKLVEAQSKAAHLEVQLRNASREPTNAGDETQIIHLRNNPLHCAVNAYGEAEKERLRKRKRKCMLALPLI
nr:unnamed protein product [Haemonchus contortus]